MVLSRYIFVPIYACSVVVVFLFNNPEAFNWNNYISGNLPSGVTQSSAQ
jgi:hypothetical protein